MTFIQADAQTPRRSDATDSMGKKKMEHDDVDGTVGVSAETLEVDGRLDDVDEDAEDVALILKSFDGNKSRIFVRIESIEFARMRAGFRG